MKCEQSVFIALDTNKGDRIEIDKSESRDSHFDNVGKLKDCISTFEGGGDAYMCVLPNESNISRILGRGFNPQQEALELHFSQLVAVES